MKKNDSKIRIYDIETNNLKGIDVGIDKRGINIIIGPSGSGKSSLAYDTIAQIGMHEYMCMFNDDTDDPSYKVNRYENMMATVPIRQTNHNNNMRSSIGTYFGLNNRIIALFASFLGMDVQSFSLGREENACAVCHGLGYVDKLDENKIINYRKALKENPFKCWNRYSDFYSRMLRKVCQDNDIDMEKTFEELTQKEKEFLLYGESNDKYHISFTHNMYSSSRTTKFYGVMTNKPMLKDKYIPDSYYSDCICEECGGMKYSKEILCLKVCGVSIGEFMNTPFGEMETLLEKFRGQSKSETQKEYINTICRFVEKANILYLRHLFFNRAIPTLSGGELQRLRLIQVFNSQLNDLVIVLDEPLAGLSGDEKSQVYKNILKLANDHSLVIVDHSEMFYESAKTIIALGPGSGALGGNIIDSQEYIKQQRACRIVKKQKVCAIQKIKVKGNIYGFRGIEVSIAEKGLTLIRGQSGIGKSTLLREYFPRAFDNYFYVDQKPAEGNVNSNVATLLGIASPISKKFAEKYSMEQTCFSNASGKEGACPRCSGKGFNEFGGIVLSCKECNGTGFNKKLKQYSIYGKNIFQIYSMTISEAINFFETQDSKICKKLDAAENVLLGHLQLGQRTSTLSGGENIRIKLIQIEGKTAQIIGVDEPFKGLNKIEIDKVAGYLRQLRDKERTIIVVDHTEGTDEYFDFHQRLTVDKRGYISGSVT